MLITPRLAALGAACALAFVAAPAFADAMTVTFDGDVPVGALPGGGDARVAGNANTWWLPDNAATYGVVKAGVGRSGSNGLEVGNRGNGNDGVINNVQSGRLAQAAGETSSGAPLKNFRSEFWFRTASTASVAGFAFKTESWGSDRTTWLGFFDNTKGGLEIEASGIDANGDFTSSIPAVALNYGDWYRIVIDIMFVDGGVANDEVTYSIFDSANVLLATINEKTWEEGQRQTIPANGMPYNGGQQVAVDAVGFQSRYSPAGLSGAVYIDDVSWSSFANEVPEPGSLALALLAGLTGIGASRRRR